MSIAFTQFVRPFGHQKEILIERSTEIEAKARQLVEVGYLFEIEDTGGMIHIELIHRQDPDGENSFSRFVRNGPEVPIAIDEVIMETHRFWKEGARVEAQD